MLDLNKLFSEGILEKFREIIKIILDYFKLVGVNRLISNKIPIKKFAPKFVRNEVEAVVNRIAKEENNIIQIDSSERRATLYELSPEEKLEKKAELKDNLFLIINDKNKLEKLLVRIEVRIEEIRKEETNAKKTAAKTAVTKPFLKTEKGKGFLVFGKKKIEIGKVDGRRFKLLNCLFAPIGTARTIDNAFEAIRLKKDKANDDLTDSYLGRRKKEGIIASARREIYRILKMNESSGVLKIHIDDKKVWLEWC